MLHELKCIGFVFIAVKTELHEQHEFVGVHAETNHHIAKKSYSLADVEEGKVVLNSVGAYRVANTIANVVHEVALLDVENLVECAGNVETNTVHIVKAFASLNLLCREPTLVGETKFEFVAIGILLVAAEDGADFGELDLPDATKIVLHLLLLVLELFLIGEALPFAAPAYTIVLANRSNASGRWFYDAGYLGFGIAVFFLFNLKVNNVARHCVRYEDNKVVDFCNGFPFCSNARDGYILKEWKRFFLS